MGFTPAPSYLLLQGGGYLNLQSGGKLILWKNSS